jgi:hypothetical protein
MSVTLYRRPGQMKKIPAVILIFILPLISSAQEFVVKNYKYRLVSTELSPKAAIQQAKSEALTACVQENLGLQVMNLTRMQKQDDNQRYTEKFNEYTQQISNGFIRRFKIIDTVSTFNQETLSLETRITLDITLYKPEGENELGLTATTGKANFKTGETAEINYSVKESAYIYLFDLNYWNEYCLIYESKEPLKANVTTTFPTAGMIYELAMTKEEKNDYEFGSFVMVAAEKPMNFAVRAGVDNNWKFDCLAFDRFFQVISAVKKHYSISYLPYCIEEPKK